MNTPNSGIRLTQLSHSGGCGCKLAPSVLERILSKITLPSIENFPQLLIGNIHSDDAAVIKADGENYLLLTTDFFLPIVDDPYDFGKIAAANALSDIYAMGGTPLAALALVGWPIGEYPPDPVAQILNGAQDLCGTVHTPIAGGHSIDNVEPFFGLVALGTVHPSQLRSNAMGKPGDLLFLTKPLGIGIYGAAIKKGLIHPQDYALFMETTTRLNAVGAELAKLPYVHAMTDVTGFGLLGHLLEICRASNVAATIYQSKIPTLANLHHYLNHNCIPGGTKRNWESYGHYIQLQNMQWRSILADPQTSGGLLFSVAQEGEKFVGEILQEHGIPFTQPIGMLHNSDQKAYPITVLP